MLNQLARLANRLDRKGLIKEANIIDQIIKKVQEDLAILNYDH